MDFFTRRHHNTNLTHTHTMAKLHDQKYKNWDKFANEQTTTLDKEDALEIEQAKKDLGHHAPKSKDEAAERTKHAQAMATKKALDKQKETEEFAKYIVSDKTSETITLSGPDLSGKKIITLKNLTSCNVSIPKGPSPLIKIFAESCTDTTISLSAKLLTSHLEMTHCNNSTLNVSDSVLSTVQLDLCDGVTINYADGTFGVFDELGDCNDRVYHAGVKDLTVNVERGSETLSQRCDYLNDGAVCIAEASKEEYQFVTQILKQTKKVRKISRFEEWRVKLTQIQIHSL